MKHRYLLLCYKVQFRLCYQTVYNVVIIGFCIHFALIECDGSFATSDDNLLVFVMAQTDGYGSFCEYELVRSRGHNLVRRYNANMQVLTDSKHLFPLKLRPQGLWGRY